MHPRASRLFDLGDPTASRPHQQVGAGLVHLASIIAISVEACG